MVEVAIEGSDRNGFGSGPGLREADIALTEIAKGKLMFESTFGQNGSAELPARIVLFPDVAESKKANKIVAKKAA